MDDPEKNTSLKEMSSLLPNRKVIFHLSGDTDISRLKHEAEWGNSRSLDSRGSLHLCGPGPQEGNKSVRDFVGTFKIPTHKIGRMGHS